MILVDTSTWIGHFRESDSRLVELLARGTAATCAVVRAELRLGAGVPREAAPLLDRLPDLPVPDARAALAFLGRHHRHLASAGIGYADLLILACAAGSGSLLRTSDRRLAAAWRSLGFAAG